MANMTYLTKLSDEQRRIRTEKSIAAKKRNMKSSEEKRIEQVLDGLAVVANINRDPDLIAWGRANNCLVYIGRKSVKHGLPESKWANRNIMLNNHAGRDRDHVCERFAEDLAGNAELMAALPELRAKVLACYCYPARCHGDHLAALVNGGVCE